jgi:hypothetical protein
VSPVHLTASAQVRLRRLAPGAAYREDMAQLLVPVDSEESVSSFVRLVIEELLPADSKSAGDTL